MKRSSWLILQVLAAAGGIWFGVWVFHAVAS
jgi:hypothetical protein